MKRLSRWIGSLLVASLCFSNVYGQAMEVYANKTLFANRLDALQTGTNKLSINLQGNMTREEAAVLIVESLGYSSIAQKYAQYDVFQDVTTHKGEIYLVKTLGIMSGVSGTSFKPTDYITKADSEAILQRLESKIETPFAWQHACYAISSSSQMDLIENYDAISFGWANLAYLNGSFKINTTTGDFKVPTGFETAIDEAKVHNTETYLMLYYDDKEYRASELFASSAQRKAVIDEIVGLTNNFSKDGVTRSFDGVTIDFEQFYNDNLKAPYVSFLKELKEALKTQGKKLNVAVQPTTYFKGYDYKGIGEVADHVILMAHDYGAKVLNAQEQASGIVMTPLTPIKNVYVTLQQAVNSIGDKRKIAIQMSYSSAQWQLQQGIVLNSTAYTPDYKQIDARLHTAGTIVHFDEASQNAYATYENNGIKNVIWYENQRSLDAKANLAKILGIQGISYWRLGLIP